MYCFMLSTMSTGNYYNQHKMSFKNNSLHVDNAEHLILTNIT